MRPGAANPRLPRIALGTRTRARVRIRVGVSPDGERAAVGRNPQIGRVVSRGNHLRSQNEVESNAVAGIFFGKEVKFFSGK